MITPLYCLHILFQFPHQLYLIFCTSIVSITPFLLTTSSPDLNCERYNLIHILVNLWINCFTVKDLDFNLEREHFSKTLDPSFWRKLKVQFF